MKPISLKRRSLFRSNLSKWNLSRPRHTSDKLTFHFILDLQNVWPQFLDALINTASALKLRGILYFLLYMSRPRAYFLLNWEAKVPATLFNKRAFLLNWWWSALWKVVVSRRQWPLLGVWGLLATHLLWMLFESLVLWEFQIVCSQVLTLFWEIEVLLPPVCKEYFSLLAFLVDMRWRVVSRVKFILLLGSRPYSEGYFPFSIERSVPFCLDKSGRPESWTWVSEV